MHIPDNTISVLHTVHKLVLKTFLDAILYFLLLAIKKHTKKLNVLNVIVQYLYYKITYTEKFR